MSSSAAPGALAIQLARADGRELGGNGTQSARLSSSKGLRLFQDFQAENSLLGPYNPAVAECVAGLEFVAFLRPATLLVAGSQLHLECVRGASARGLLRPPAGYTIRSIGDVGERTTEMPSTPKFYPLADALCSLIGGLNAVGHPATIHSLHKALGRRFHQTATTPPVEAVEKTLNWLLSEGRLYCMGSHYFLATPEMYAQFQAQKALLAQHQAPWTNSLPRPDSKGACREIETQTGESIVCGVPAYKPRKDAASEAKPAPAVQQIKAPGKDKASGGFFRRLFRRSKSRETLHVKETEKKEPHSNANIPNSRSSLSAEQQAIQHPIQQLTTFTAQFPPTEWLHDPQTFRMPKTRRVRKDRPPVGGSVWIDLEPGAALPPPRRRANDPRIVGGRFPSQDTRRGSPKAERRRTHRLHKYLSSSSEALHPLTPRAPHPFDEKRKHRRQHHQIQPLPESPRAPLAAPTTTTDLDSTMDALKCPSQATSPDQDPPTPKAETAPGPSTTTVLNPRVSDSALSASPVVTEMSSSSSAKFSSWSGSEGRQVPSTADPSYVNLPTRDCRDRIMEETGPCEDRMPSPIGPPPSPPPAHDPTYENLGLESTNFENLSLEEDPILAGDSSLHIQANYISAL